MKKDNITKNRFDVSSAGRYYRTRYFYLAAYLYANDMTLVNIEKESSGKYVFVFRDMGEREALVYEFEYGPEALVDARKFIIAIGELEFQKEEVDLRSTPPIQL